MIICKTISEAITDLRKRGYRIDFNLGLGGLCPHKSVFSLAADKFEITEVHRFEGESNPDDEAVSYAIESPDGHMGILVNG